MWPGPTLENLGNYHIVELPPHTQENTKRGRRSISLLRNYLRARGEYKSSLKSSTPSQELPPRARRILNQLREFRLGAGTTSAYAENTGHRWWSRHGSRNYLRVRGEYAQAWQPGIPAMELPPRARRIRDADKGQVRAIGTTSACAENTCRC